MHNPDPRMVVMVASIVLVVLTLSAFYLGYVVSSGDYVNAVFPAIVLVAGIAIVVFASRRNP